MRTLDFQMLVPLSWVFVFKRRHMRNDEFLARHSEFDADVKWLAAPMMPVRRASTITRQLAMRSKYLSSLSASSWIRSVTAADASIFRKVVWTGKIMMV